MKHSRFFSFFATTIVALTLVLTFSTCKPGLGEAVDIYAPTLSISYPTAKSVIRDTFVMHGAVSDDNKVKDVTVVFTGREGTTGTYGPFTATVDANAKTWTINLNKPTTPTVASWQKSYEIKDGNYEIVVTAQDTSGRKTTASTVYEIDNTAPVALINSPATTAIAVKNAEPFGANFNLKGSLYDDHPIDKLVLYVWDNGTTNRKLLRREVIDNVVQSMDVDRVFEASDPNAFYNALYGNDKTQGAKAFYYTLEVYDSARDYKGNAASGEGNASEVFYFYRDVVGLGNNIKARDIYKVLSGYTSTQITTSEDKDKLFEKEATSAFFGIKTAYLPKAENATYSVADIKKMGTFSLNPNEAPSYSIASLNPLKGPDETRTVYAILTDSVISSKSYLSITLSPNLDNKPVAQDVPFGTANPDDITTWPKGYVEVWAATYDGLDGSGNIKTKEPKHKLWPNTDPKASGTISQDKAIITVPCTSLPTTEYVLEVKGTDTKGNRYNDHGKPYGFKLQGAGAPPYLEIDKTKIDNGSDITTTPEKTNLYVQKGKTFTVFFKGTSFATPKHLHAKYYLNTVLSDEETIATLATTGTLPGGFPDLATKRNTTTAETGADSGVYTWNITPLVSKFNQVKSTDYEVSIVVTDKDGRTAEKTMRVWYDVVNPVVDSFDISPQVTANGKSNNVNGSITVKGTISDDDKVKESSFEIRKVVSGVETDSTETYRAAVGAAVGFNKFTDPARFNFTLDTTKLSNNTEYIIRIKATDRAGLSVTSDTTIYVDQDTDKPIITFKGYHSIPYEAGRAKKELGTEPYAAGTITAEQREIIKIPLSLNIAPLTTADQTKVVDALTILNASPTSLTVAQKTTIKAALDALLAAVGTLSSTNKILCTGNLFDKVAPNNKLSINVSDDDGIKKVDWRYKTGSGAFNAFTNVYDAGASGPYPINRAVDITMPDEVGQYIVELQITDSYGLELSSGVFYVGVDDGKPSVAVNGLQNEWKSGSITVTGSISDIGGLKAIASTGDGTVTSLSTSPATLSETTTSATWTETFTAPGSSGSYSRTYTVTDIYGKTNTAVYNFKVDVTKPEVVISTTNNQFIKKENLFSVSGTASDDAGGSGVAKVQFSYDNATWTDATGTGNWSASLDFTSKTEGTYTVSFRSLDLAGNTSDAKTLTVKVDVAPPTASIVVGTAGTGKDFVKDGINYRGNGSFSLTGDAKDTNYTSSKLMVSKNGAAATEVAAGTNANEYNRNSGNGTWSYTPPLAEGLYVYTLTVTDAAGRISTDTATVQVDTSVPDLVITAPSNNESTADAAYTIKGTARDSGAKIKTLEISFDNGSNWETLSLSGIDWTKSKTLTAQGGQAFIVRCADNVGNSTTSSSRTWYYDLNDPTLTETAINTEDLQYIKNGGANIVYSGKAKDTWKLSGANAVTVSINGAAATEVTNSTAANTDETWSYTFDKTSRTDGTYVLVFTANDAAGKKATLTRKVMIDQTAPTISSPSYDTAADKTVGTVNWYKANSVKIKGTASDATSGLEKAEYSIDGTNWNALSGTASWSGTLAGLTEAAAYTVQVRLTDKAGNAKIETLTNKVRIDTIQPTLTVNTSAGYAKSTFSITGTVNDANIEKLVYTRTRTNSTGTADVSDVTVTTSNGAWTLNQTSLADDTYKYVFKATDIAGNVTTSSEYTITIDSTAPTGVITNPTNLANTDPAYWLPTTTPAFSGTASDGASGVAKVYYAVGATAPTVTVYPVAMAGWTEATGSTSWSAASATLAEGEHSLHIVVEDRAGNRSATVSQNFGVDISAPTLTAGTDPASVAIVNSTNAGTFVGFKGAISDTHGLATTGALTVSYTKDGGADTSLTPTISSGNWTLGFAVNATTHAQDGTYVFTFTAKDKASKTTVKTVNLKVDTTSAVPTVSNLSANGFVETSSFTFKGSTDDGTGMGVEEVYVKVGVPADDFATEAPTAGNKWKTATGTTSWSAAIDLTASPLTTTQGKRVLWVKTKDKAGNITTATEAVSATNKIEFEYDKDLPVIAETTVNTSDTQYIKADLIFNGTALDTNKLSGANAVTVTIDGGAETQVLSSSAVNTSTGWTYTYSGSTANAGAHTLVFKVKDAAGKTATITRQVFVDRTAPTLSSITALTGWKKTTGVAFSGTVADGSGSGVVRVEYRVSPDGTTYGAWTAATLSGANFNGTAVFADGETNTIQIRAVDRAGNESTPVAGDNSLQTVKVDTVKPSLAVTSPATTPLLNGSSSLAITVSTSDNASSATNGAATVYAKVGSDFTNEADTGDVTQTVNSTSTTLTAPQIKISSLGAGSQKIYLKSVDAAGNYSPSTILYVTIDKTVPTVTLTSHAESAVVNKKIALSGTSDDPSGITSVKLQIWTKSGTWAWVDMPSGIVTSATATGTVSWSLADVNTSFITNNSSTYDSDAAAGLQVKVKAVATDGAGNTGEVERVLVVDQESDKPIIKLSNLAATGNPFLKTTNIYGTVSDDDGPITELKIATSEPSDWASIPAVTMGGNSFSYNVSGGDGQKALYFKITDSVSTVFITAAASSLGTPRVWVDNTPSYTHAAVQFKLDTVPADISSAVKVNSTSVLNGAANLENGAPFGTKPLFLRIEAKDANGIASVSATITGKDKAAPATTKIITQALTLNTGATGVTSGYEAYDTSAGMDVTGFADGTCELKITVTDDAGLTSFVSRSITVDNTKPSINVLSPGNADQVTGTFAVNGTGSDALSGLQKLEYKLGKSAGAAWTEYSGGSLAQWSFNIKASDYANSTDATETASSSGIWILPIEFRLTDKAGNVETKTGYSLKLDPSGDKPKVTIDYPASGSTLGGQVRISGSAQDNNAVFKVFMMVDANADGSYDSGDDNFNVGGTLINWYNGGNGQEVTGKNAWSYTINTKGEFNPTSGTTKTIKLKVRAQDTKNGTSGDITGEWVEATIIFDDTVPRIGSTTSLFLYQGPAAAPTATKTYSPNMFITGDWKLGGSVEDESAIKTIAVRDGLKNGIASSDYAAEITCSNGNQSGTNHTWVTPSTAGSSKKYDLAIPISTGTSGSGNISFTLLATDETAKAVQQEIKLRYDNDKPTSSYTAAVPLRNSNGSSKIGGTANDFNGSGIDKIEVYFTRADYSGTNGKFYKPKGTDSGISTTNSNLAWGAATAPTKEFSNETAPYPNAAGYVITVDYSLGAEVGAGKDTDGYWEGLVPASGTEYTWFVDIDSSSIPDGPIDIHYVVYDKAGNTVHAEKTTTIENKKPSISAITLGTDLNGSDSVTTEEKQSFTLTSNSATTTFKLKYAPSIIEPTVSNGNGALYYELKCGTFTKRGTLRASESAIVTAISLDADDLTAIGDGTAKAFTLTVWDSADQTKNGSNSGASSTWNTSTWTSLKTDEASITLEVDYIDGTAPTCAIKALYWTSETDNSLYQNSRDKGHIELTSVAGGAGSGPYVSGIISIRGTAFDDQRLTALWMKIADFTFTGALATSSSGTTSGYAKLATYDSVNAKWSGTETAAGSKVFVTDELATNGWKFTVTQKSLDQAGHSVEWQLDWNSAKITDAAGLNKAINMIAEDRTPNYTTTPPSLTVDVVPYITEVLTELTNANKTNPSVFNRTALGKYPVRASSKIGLRGFNLGDAPTVSINGTALAAANVSKVTTAPSADESHLAIGDIAVTIPNGQASGDLVATVSSVGSINNSNGNTNDYNKKPNKVNNELLTDDVAIDVWKIDSSVAVPIRGKITEPVMKINPSNGLIGFAFANGPDYFSMAHSGNSYQTWQRNYDDFGAVAMAYGSDGKSHAVVAGRDTNSSKNEAGKFTYLTSMWGPGGLGAGDNYDGSNNIRLETLGQVGYKDGGSDNIIDKTRIMSPSIAVAGANRVYLAYYDGINQQIRFRYGNTPSGYGNFDQFDASSAAPGVIQVYNYNGQAARYSLVADAAYHGAKQTPAAYLPGEHLALAVVPGANAAADVVVLVWFETAGQRLMYSYKTTPQNDRDSGDANGSWSVPKEIFAGAGEHCRIAVDPKNGIHIAAYDITNADLKYAYMPSYNSATLKTCTVDSYSIVGTSITLDTALTSGGNKVVPYIGYFMQAAQKPKLAYLVGGITPSTGDEVVDGVASEKFVGNWEISMVPTVSRVPDSRINVGVWRDAGGKINVSTSTVSTAESATTASGIQKGNGTSNPVLGYVIGTGKLEKAQKN